MPEGTSASVNSYLDRPLKAMPNEYINTIFSFLDFKSIYNFYRAIGTKVEINMFSLFVREVLTRRTYDPKELAFQSRVIMQNAFVPALDDRLVYDALSSSLPFSFKLKILLENIIRNSAQAQLPDDLYQEIYHLNIDEKNDPDVIFLCEQYVFLVGYLNPKTQQLLVDKVITDLNLLIENKQYDNAKIVISYLKNLISFIKVIKEIPLQKEIIDKQAEIIEKNDVSSNAVTIPVEAIVSDSQALIRSKIAAVLNKDSECPADDVEDLINIFLNPNFNFKNKALREEIDGAINTLATTPSEWGLDRVARFAIRIEHSRIEIKAGLFGDHARPVVEVPAVVNGLTASPPHP